MAEPQSSNIEEGASQPPAPTGTAEDRKAAAALSSLDAQHNDDSAADTKKDVDTEALGKAMQNLDGGAGGKKAEVKKAEVKKVKIDAADVTLLVEQLELSKVKATELLKAHEGNAAEALKVFVSASA